MSVQKIKKIGAVGNIPTMLPEEGKQCRRQKMEGKLWCSLATMGRDRTCKARGDWKDWGREWEIQWILGRTEGRGTT